MTSTYISIELQQQVRADAERQCGYCRHPESLLGMPLEFEHLIPLSGGGQTARSNLWLACRRCNQFKGGRFEAIDPQTNQLVPLFNPRAQRWTDHFVWSSDGTQIFGLTPIGRATVQAVHLNNDYAVETRCFWVEAGWWPPND